MGRSEREVQTKTAKGSINSQPAALNSDADWDAWMSKGNKATPGNKEKREQPTVKMRVSVEENWEDKPLTSKQEKFCRLFAESNNGKQSAIQAGYSENCAEVIASETLRKPNVAKRIKELRDKMAKSSIATGQEVMQFFTDVMTGKIKDQFGLETSVADRTKAAVELAKRTVDLDQKLAGKPDATVEIKLDWKRD